jgi:hypothetical protein
MDATQQESEQNSLFSKLAAIKGQESNSQCEPKSLHFGEVVGYLDLFDELPMSILSGVLDVAIAAEVRQLPYVDAGDYYYFSPCFFVFPSNRY